MAVQAYSLHPLQNIIPRFTEDELTDIKEWFEKESKPLLVIDTIETVNVITVEQYEQFLNLKKFHRRNYHYPSYGELMKEVEFLQMGTVRVITEEQFIYLLNKWLLKPVLKKELLLAFKVFDTEQRDFLDLEELVPIVTKYGNIFDEAELTEFVRDVNIRGDGMVFYEDFIECIFSNFPQFNDLETEYLYLNPDEDPTVPPLPPEPEPEPEPVPVLAPPPPKLDKKGKGKGKKK